MRDKIREYILSHKEEMLNDLAALVEIPSVKGEPSEGAPFGEQPRRALDKMLDICKSKGLAVSCCENAVGTAEYSPEGEAALGILCHLDVVPARAEDWSTPPYTLTEKDGVLYGRGVIDDKGPAVAALYAIDCVKALGIPLKRGVKLIFGTDEENGSGDLDIYLAREKLPENVFTPDGSFPVINIEKGMMRSRFSGKCDGGSVVNFRGGEIPNAVPDKASAVISGVSAEEAKKAASGIEGVTFSVTESGGNITVECFGRSAHASTPEAGANAVTALIALLNKLPLKPGKQADILRRLESAFPFGETDGASAGLRCADKTGALTLVFSIFEMSGEDCRGVIDVRFPSCMSLAEVERRERSVLEQAGCSFSGYMGDEPHIVDENSEFVQSLLRVYERVEGEPGRCIAIGGGTYVHNIEGGVAFGAERGDTDYHMHAADEFIPTDELLRDAILFAEVIIEICG